MFNFYGFFLSLGILTGVLIIEKIKTSFKADKIKLTKFLTQIDTFSIFPWVLIPGIIGARIYHIIDYWHYYQQNLIKTLYIWQGGLGIFGTIIGSISGLFLFKKYQKLTNNQLLSLLDLGAIGLSIGQAIGRWGNYFNQELYGLPTNLPWGIYIKPENRLLELKSFTHFHPLFFYESLGCLIIFLILLKILKKIKRTKKTGLIFLSYLFLYSLLRFMLEFLRPQAWQVSFLYLQYIRVTHIITTILMLISIFALIKKFVTMKKVNK